jgi:hypothetical protein
VDRPCITRSSTLLADALVYGVALYAVGREATLKRRAARLCGWLQVALAVVALAEVLRRTIFGSEPAPPLMAGISSSPSPRTSRACGWWPATVREACT